VAALKGSWEKGGVRAIGAVYMIGYLLVEGLAVRGSR
jgi:hypothetical protein